MSEHLGIRGHLVALAALPLALAAANAQEQYRLGPKDVLSIVVLGNSDLSSQEPQQMTVRPDGRTSYPVVGEVDVSGKTTAEVQEIIRTALERHYRHVEVAVNLAKARESRIYVLGEVNAPGAFDLAHEDIGVREAIAMAGGLTPQASNNDCYLYGRDVDPMRIDLAALMADADNAGQPRLAPGDTLVVQTKKMIAIVGEVQTPGVYQMEDGARLLDAIAMAGGLTERSDRREATLLRTDQKNDTIDMSAALASPASDANVPLRGGDTLVIKEARNEVAILGAVERPAAFCAAAGLTAAQALAMAGGVKPEADLAHVKLLRPGEEPRILDVQPLVQSTRVTSLEQFAATGDEVVLQRGDVLIVPERFARVIVLGAVRSAGAHPIRPGDRVTDALAAAGGQIARKSAVRRIALMRRNGDRVIVRKIDLRQLMAGRNQSQNELVQDGDIIVVPGAKKINWQDNALLLLGAASAAGQLADIF